MFAEADDGLPAACGEAGELGEVEGGEGGGEEGDEGFEFGGGNDEAEVVDGHGGG